MKAKLIDSMVDDFLRWPLPDSVCVDGCATKQGPGRIGTNLLTAIEAKKMFEAVVLPKLRETPEGAPPALTYQPQHLWSDGEFDIWSPIGAPTVSKVITRSRLDIFLSIHPDAKVRVLKIQSSAEAVAAENL